MTSKIVFEIIRLWFHTMPHTWENKHEDRHSIKKESGEYQKWQQGCSDIKRRTMDKKTDDDRDNYDMKESSSRRNHFNRRNMTK